MLSELNLITSTHQSKGACLSYQVTEAIKNNKFIVQHEEANIDPPHF